MNTKVNLAHFSKVFKERIYLRSKQSQPSEIVLLEAFKYYDTKRNGQCDYKLFSNVLKRKFEMNMFSENDIRGVFDYYCEFLGGKNTQSFQYKDFIALFLNVSNVKTSNTVRERSALTKSHRTQKINPENIGSVVEFLLMKGKKRELGFFFYLYKSMYTHRKNLDEEKLQQVLQKYNINLSHEEVQNLLYFFDQGNQKIDFYKLWDILSANFNTQRKQEAREMFTRLDFRNAGFVNFEVLQKIFLPKNFYKVQQGLMSLNQVAKEFNQYIENFTYFVQTQNVDKRDFILFMQMLSIQIDKDKDFQAFIKNCFRYNDIKQMSFQNSHQKDYKNLQNQKNTDHQYTEGELLSALKQQLRKRGLNSYLHFYFILKKKDHQKDGFLFYDDFYQILQEFKIILSEKEIKALFSNFCNKGVKMNYNLLLESLVPFFTTAQCKQIKLLFQKLGSQGNTVRFEKFQDFINPQYHPEVISNDKISEVVKKEFLENLQQFLVYYKGNHLQVDQDSFVRFLEFYSRDWEIQTLNNFLENAFSKQQHKNYNHFQNVVNKPPFATNYPSSKDFTKKVGNQKLYEEFSQQQKSNYQVRSPYHVEEMSQKRSINQSIRKSRRTQKLSQVERSQRSQVSQITRQSKSIRSYLSKPSNKKIHEINLELQKHHKPSEDNSQHQEDIPETSSIQKLRQVIRNSGDFSLMLEYEYVLTNESNLQGEISREKFIQCSQQLKCIQDLSEKELNVVFDQLKEGSQLHVQGFANYLRDQMSEDEEVLTIDLFDRLCAKYHSEVLDVNKFRSCFMAKNFTYAKGSTSHIQDMFNFTIDLFEALNITIKNVTWLDLDDFLYLFDNFTFYFNDVKKYGDMLARCFR